VTELVIEAPATSKPWRRRLAWSSFALGALLFFTLLKLPEARLTAYLTGLLSAELGKRGVTLTASETDLGLLLGLRFSLQGVTLTFPPPLAPLKIDEITLRPSLLGLLRGRAGASLEIEAGKAQVTGTVSSGLSPSSARYQLDLELENIDLAKTGLLALAAGVQASGTLNGSIDLTLDLAKLSESQGTIDLTLSKGALEAQTIQGFPVPRIGLSEVRLLAEIEGEQLKFKTAKIGKLDAGDDLIATLTGGLKLNRFLESSTLNVTANFSVSEAVMKAFPILNALLAAGKQGDGSFTYQLAGSLNAPLPTPVAAK
jgi:type II secretion system protein N